MSDNVSRGPAVLRQILDEKLFDLRTLDTDRFRDWLAIHLGNWSSDPVFLQRSRVRDLRRSHPILHTLEEERRELRARDRASPVFATLEEVEKEMAGAENAVAGLTHALRSAEDATERERLGARLDEFTSRATELRVNLVELSASSPERTALRRVESDLEEARERVGFYREVTRLETLQREQGRSSGKSGAAFETASSKATRAVLLPELGGADSRPLAILHGVKLGAARTEIDQLIVRPGERRTDPVEVVALVEAKRNPNDLAHGLQRRLENVAWLAGFRGGYDAELYRTRSSPWGHFEGQAIHGEGGQSYRFDRESFARFLPDLSAGALPRHLYLVTRAATLWGIASSGLGRIAHRISSDVDWDPTDEEYLAQLLSWCLTLTKDFEAPDLLRQYEADEDSARRLLLLAD